MTPNPNRLDLLDRLIDEYRIDAVVEITLQACHTYNVETALVGKLVKEKKGIPYTQTTDLESVIPQLDVLYMTRIQRERFVDPLEYERNKGIYILTRRKLERAKPSMLVMHPLPRVDEISIDVDDDPRAVYFQQARYGMFARMALLEHLALQPRDEHPAPVEIGTRPICRNPRCITQTEHYLPPLVKRIGGVDCCGFCDAALC